MKKTSGYITSLLIILSSFQAMGQVAQPEAIDTVIFPLKVRAGLELSGPVIYFAGSEALNLEAYVNADINEKYSIYLGGGYSDYSYSQYNYSFLSKGTFYKAGIDVNLLKPAISVGRYWAGVGLHYGLCRFMAETPSLWHENYWGNVSSAVPANTSWGHFLELSGGFRAELFRNFSIGWMISARKLIYDGSGKDLRPVHYPGYGEGGSSLSFGINYFISWNIPFRKILVPVYPEPPEEPEEGEDAGQDNDTRNVGRQGVLR